MSQDKKLRKAERGRSIRSRVSPELTGGLELGAPTHKNGKWNVCEVGCIMKYSEMRDVSGDSRVHSDLRLQDRFRSEAGEQYRRVQLSHPRYEKPNSRDSRLKIALSQRANCFSLCLS